MCGIFPRMAMYMCVCVCVYDCPTTCVFAQYSSTAFVSLHFQSCKKKFGTCLKNVISVFFTLKLCKSEIA